MTPPSEENNPNDPSALAHAALMMQLLDEAFSEVGAALTAYSVAKSRALVAMKLHQILPEQYAEQVLDPLDYLTRTICVAALTIMECSGLTVDVYDQMRATVAEQLARVRSEEEARYQEYFERT